MQGGGAKGPAAGSRGLGASKWLTEGEGLVSCGEPQGSVLGRLDDEEPRSLDTGRREGTAMGDEGGPPMREDSEAMSHS